MDETRRRSQQACDNHNKNEEDDPPSKAWWLRLVWHTEGEFPGGMLIIADSLSLRMGFLHHLVTGDPLVDC